MPRLVVVQSRAANQGDPAKLAAALDEVALQRNATVVFFAAGTVRGHDSFAFYEKIRDSMSRPAIVYKAEHLWKVVGLVSMADVVLSTSLHVRIMAFLHGKPRVTWCEAGGKHERFIRLWDITGSARCVSVRRFDQTWAALHKHYLGGNDADPGVSRTETLALAEKHVEKYLESFAAYSELLRPMSSSV